MKAVIMAGGKGTRGRPYTDYFPKAMIPVSGRPLVRRVAEYLEQHYEVIVVCDLAGLGGQIRHHLRDKNYRFVQDSGSGTGGDILHAEDALAGDDFVLWFVDNLCAVDLKSMEAAFRSMGAPACVATRKRRREATGFAAVSDAGLVEKFMEKPTLELAYHECLGIYMMQNSMLDKIRATGSKVVNLSFDVLEGLPRMSAFDIGDSQWLDVESPTVISRNADEADSIARAMQA